MPTKAEIRRAIGTSQFAGQPAFEDLLDKVMDTVSANLTMASGTVTPTSASHTVVTGLSLVSFAVAQLKGAPTLTMMFVQANIGDQAGSPAAGSILIVSQKPTTNLDVTPIASTTPWAAVDWIAIGTK